MIDSQPRSGHLCFFTTGVRNVHQNYLCTALLFSWYAAPSSEYLPPSCLRRSLPRCSWAPLECLAHIWLYVPLLGTKMRSLEATSPESMGASGELSFVKLFSRQILHEENRGTRPLRGSWRHLAGTNIDVVLPNSSLIARQYSWGLVPGIRSSLLIPGTKQQGGFAHPQSPPRPSLSRHEPSCTQLLCGDLKAPSVDISACLETVSGQTIFHPTIWLSGTILLQKSTKKCKLPTLISCWLDWDTASSVACTPSTWDSSSKCSKLPHSLSQGLLLPPLCGILDFARKNFSLPRCCYAMAHSICRQGPVVEELILLENVSEFLWMQGYSELHVASLGKIPFWIFFGPPWCSWTVHIWWGWMLLAARWKENSSWSGDLGCVFDPFFQFSSPDDKRNFEIHAFLYKCPTLVVV